MRHRKGFTLVELLVVMGIIALLLGLLLPALNKARKTARRVKDQSQIQQMHKGFLVGARDFDGMLPSPGHARRSQWNGQWVPGRGEVDLVANDHANLHALACMRNYFSPVILVSPTETNAHVAVSTDMNFDVYDPTEGIYWDNHYCVPGVSHFEADLSGRCNTSYAFHVLDGQRFQREHQETLNSQYAIGGTRGPLGGQLGDVYKNSKTLGLLGPVDEWNGNIVHNDNHVDFVNTFYLQEIQLLPTGFNNELGGREDNIFANDMGGGNALTGYDCWLTIVSGIEGDNTSRTHTIHHD